MWIYLILFWLLGPGIQGQCISCDQRWGFTCNPKYTGYYCDGNQTHVNTVYLSKDELATSTTEAYNIFAECVPYPYQIEHIHTFCCLYSPKIGCQMALNPSLYQFVKHPGTYCDRCKKHCNCPFNAAVRPLGTVVLLSASLSSFLRAMATVSY